MARISLHIDAEDLSDFRQTLGALAGDHAPRAAGLPSALGAPYGEEDGAERPTVAATQDAETAAPKRMRRARAEIAAGEAAKISQSAATTAATSTAPHGSDDGESAAVTLEAINLKIVSLMEDKKVPAEKLQEVLKQATDGNFGSANVAARNGGEHYFPAIWSGLLALEEAS